MKVTLIHAYNSSALYIDGTLAFEDLAIDVQDGLTACKGYVIDAVVSRQLNDDGYEWIGENNFPEDMSEISEEMFE